jgi:hypothetical protein
LEFSRSDDAQQLSACACVRTRSDPELCESPLCIGQSPPSAQQAMRASGVASHPAQTAAFPAIRPMAKMTADRRLMRIRTSQRMLKLGQSVKPTHVAGPLHDRESRGRRASFGPRFAPPVRALARKPERGRNASRVSQKPKENIKIQPQCDVRVMLLGHLRTWTGGGGGVNWEVGCLTLCRLFWVSSR